MKIEVQVRNVFGNDLIYPMCNKAAKFCQIAGTKTLTQYDIKLIKELGYKIETVAQEL